MAPHSLVLRSKFIILLIFILLQTSNLFAQNKSFTDLRAQIKADVKHLMKETFFSRRDPDFDTEPYCNRIAKKLQKLLTYEEAREIMNLDDFTYKMGNIKTLKLAVHTDDYRNIRIYDFGYDCGGTRGWITHPIIQYTNAAGELYTYNMSGKINSSFYKIHLLEKDLYLLLGDEKGDGACRNQTAYIIQFKDNYLILDYPAFIDRPDLNFCNINFDYNPKTKILKAKAELKNYPDGKKHYDSSVYNLQYEYKDVNERNKWYSYLAIDYNNGDFKLKFKNGAFRKMRKNQFDAFYGIYED